jgi:hypothetical protein
MLRQDLGLADESPGEGRMAGIESSKRQCTGLASVAGRRSELGGAESAATAHGCWVPGKGAPNARKVRPPQFIRLILFEHRKATDMLTLPRFHVQQEVGNFVCMENRDAR